MTNHRLGVRDVALWALLGLPAGLSPAVPSWWDEGSDVAGVTMSVVGVAAVTAAMLLRRRSPLTAMMIALAAGAWSVNESLATVDPWGLEQLDTMRLGPLNGLTLAIVVFGYGAGRRMDRARTALLAYAAILGGGLFAILIVSFAPAGNAAIAGFWIPVLSGALLSGLLPYAIGRMAWQRAEARVRERELATGQARLRERNRIAHDMHDSIGHDLALIALRAAALEVAPDLGERHRRTAGDLRIAAADTTERLRQVIGVLREEDRAPVTPPVESVTEIVERARRYGVRAELRGDGSLRDRTASRVVQEALTNATKHASGAPVIIELASAGAEIAVTVTNRAPESRPARPNGGGLGLIGLHERVRLAGGTFEASARSGVFRLTARFPSGDGAR
ncbi:histidine kinase [Streptosporangium soli]|nr:histidine kinase [Streptosporangium sp. KLBMP 9127]